MMRSSRSRTTAMMMMMMMMRSSVILLLCGLYYEILQGNRVAHGFEIKSISPRHGRPAASSFPFPTTTTSTSSLMTYGPLHLRIRKPSSSSTTVSTTELSLFRRIRRLFRRGKNDKQNETATLVPITLTEAPQAPQVQREKIHPKKPQSIEKASICLIGGGVSGLAAALTAAEKFQNATTNSDNNKIVLLEASPKVGGRVQSDTTDDGYTLDRGFAVFIEEYPMAKKILDYDGTYVPVLSFYCIISWVDCTFGLRSSGLSYFYSYALSISAPGSFPVCLHASYSTQTRSVFAWCTRQGAIFQRIGACR